jgi:competence protein ComEC
MNGLIAILKKFEVSDVWESGLDTDLPGHDEFSAQIRDRTIHHRIVSADDPPMMLGDTTISVLHPHRGFDAHERQAYAAENDRSLVVRIKSEDGTFLFTGDIGTAAEWDILGNWPGMKTDLIKVPHHGSKSSSSEDFVSQVRPEIAIMTVGRGNQYHHPSDEVVARYEKTGSLICRTDLDGAVAITANKGKFAVQRWNGLALRRIALADRAAWGEQEQVNWGRLRVRASGF